VCWGFFCEVINVRSSPVLNVLAFAAALIMVGLMTAGFFHF
jgi:hypothetical protein